MGDTRAAPPRPVAAFGQVDLDLEEEPHLTVRPAPAPVTSFGHVDLDIAPPSSDRGENDPPPPPSTSRVFETKTTGAERSARVTRRNMSVHEESTRVLEGDALAAITRPPPPPSPLADDGDARAWAEVDEALLSVGHDEVPELASSQSGDQPVALGEQSHVDQVAAMRELYAKGDAEGALALATRLSESTAPRAAADGSPEASIVVELGEPSIDLSDPFGGLLLAEEEDALAARATAPPPAASPPLAPRLSLTERHSIPKMLKSMGEVSKLKIDHRAGFLLTHVDGMQTLEEILDVCAMPATEALELIEELKEMGVIEFE